MKLRYPALDSFRMYIPLSKITLTEKGKELLYDKKVLLSEDKLKKLQEGKLTKEDIENISEDELKRVSYKPREWEVKGISIRLVITERYFFNETEDTYLVILINSKLLKEKYLLGITKDTIKDIWIELLTLELFYVEFEDFLKGTIVDVDIKADIKGIGPKKFGEYIRTLDRFHEGELHTGPKNMGLQYGHRSKGNFVSKPYVKFYHKSIELIYNSDTFANNYLKNIDIKKLNLVRVECTIKNKKHFKALGIKDNTLGYILETLTEDKIIELISKFLKKYFTPERGSVMTDKDNKLNIKGKDIEILMGIKAQMLLGYNLTMIESKIRLNYKQIKASKPTISSAIKRARKFYTYLLENDKEVKKQEDFFEFLDLILNRKNA